jgi:arylsulfatase A-like enzyme
MSLQFIYPNKILVSCLLIVVVAILAFKAPLKKQSPKAKNTNPNIIIILTDDQGYGDVGFNGCKDIATPNIDKIAKNGVVFTNGYVSYAVCAPSRAGLLTGRYQDKFGFSRNPLYKPLDESIGLPATEQTMAEYVVQHGYNTMAIGKWHLGAHEKFHPLNRGFKNFFGFVGGGHRYFPEELNLPNAKAANNEEQSYRTKLEYNNNTINETEYLTDAFSREAVNFIQQNKQQPFFLYLAYNAPHSPLQAPEKYLSKYQQIQNPKRKTYAAMVSAVDDGVGNILKALDDLKITENTIVIFLSDNGGPIQDNGSNNGVLRGGKSSFFEGGIRVPFAMQWPKKIKANTVYKKPVISLDIFATVAATITNAKPTKNILDGVNMLPFIINNQQGFPHEYLFWQQYDQKNYAVLHQSGVKQIVLKDSTNLLYNVSTDIKEQNNIKGTQPIMEEQLLQQRKQWLSTIIAPTFLGLNQEEKYNQLQKQKTKE